MSFKEDLELGRENEHKVLEMIQSLFPQTQWWKNDEKKWVDIIWELWHSVECKFDRMVSKTWNVFIEVECNWKPSWIFKYERIDVISYSFDNTTLLINVEKLKNFILENKSKIRKIKWWDGWRSVWYLIKLQDILEITSRIIRYYD